MTRRLAAWPIAVRLHLCTLVAVLGLLGLATYEVRGWSQELERNRIGMLHAVVDTALASARRFEAEEKAGRMDRAAAQAAAAAAIRAMRYSGQEYLWINDAQVRPRLIMHPFRPDLEGKDVSELRDPTGFALFSAFAERVRQSGEGVVGYLWPRPGAQAPVEKLSYVAGFTPWDWVIGTGVYVDDLRAEQRAVMLNGTLAALLAATIVALLILLVARSITRPLAVTTAATTAMAGGDLDSPVPGTDRGDELGLLARALETFREGGLRTRRLEEQARAERATRDSRGEAMERLTTDFGTTVSGVLVKLTSSADGMRSAADGMARAAEKTKLEMESTAADANASSQSLATVAAATEQLTASVGEISRQVSQAAVAAQDAVLRARSTDTTVASLSDAAGQISEVVRLISDIAGQTNLLALNATIEAARAGDAGKGFAVVAAEVKQLASQTAQATSRIGAQVSAIQSATGEAVEAVRGVAAAIDQVSDIASTIAASVEQQGVATREIAVQVQAISKVTDSATRAMHDVCATAEQSGTISGTVLKAADQVAGQSDGLRQDVDHFLGAMRAVQKGGEQSRYERIPGADAPTRLKCATYGTGSATLRDISLGGASLACEWPCDVGAEVLIGLPGESEFAWARIVSSQAGVLDVAFRQDAPTQALVTHAMDALVSRSRRAA